MLGRTISLFQMRYVAAYLLAALGGNVKPSGADIEKILSSVGIESDKDKLKKNKLPRRQVVSELTGKDLETLIKEGSEKLASVPSGGGAGPAAAAAAAPAAGEAAASKKEEKKEEEEEEDEDMGFGLFD
ncbi:60S acidic ribosomal protein P2 isoform X1 [Galendromus occidentalis]|uniref:Large ribosomal subunit protein P2 n=1 Tax=Galendromus occidentalis TaxID=34638 RepID=A0AAJ7PA60_9ACAR|nr:60S acidic ribosomal protein P2 isoform X1 [Galendromus occidentalis]